MDKPHDLGGCGGFGPVPVEAVRPWSAHWQQRAMVLASLTARAAGFNGDALRHMMERISPDDYARLGSAGRWLRVAERCAVEGGLVAKAEVGDRTRRRAGGLAPPEFGAYPEPVASPTFVASSSAHNKRTPPEGARARFSVGDRVVTQNHQTEGHTRLPGYLHGKSGEIVLLNGFWVFPDTHAFDGTEAPTWVYAVRFSARHLWPDAGPHDVCADLFEPYLEAADG